MGQYCRVWRTIAASQSDTCLCERAGAGLHVAQDMLVFMNSRLLGHESGPYERVLNVLPVMRYRSVMQIDISVRARMSSEQTLFW